MSKLPNIIQRRELEPLMQKADKIAKHYEKASGCPVLVVKPDLSFENNEMSLICKHCNCETDKNRNKIFTLLHADTNKKVKQFDGYCIYTCKKNLVFWTSPFYSGERYAGTLVCGGIKESDISEEKLESLAKLLHICSEQISGLSFTQKNIMVNTRKEKKQSKKKEYKPEDEKKEAIQMDMERMLLANLRRGDTQEATNILLKILKARYNEADSTIYAFRLKAIELAVLLSRATTNPEDINDEKFTEINKLYQNKIKESTSLEEIEAILSDITEKMSERIFSFHGVRHFPALRKAERFIWENYTRKISLKEIAKASGLSAPYFSTIFKEEMGENLSDYLNRLRVEKAQGLLLTTNISIGEIAKTCGFDDQSWFSKIFKSNTGLSPGNYRDHGSIAGLSA